MKKTLHTALMLSWIIIAGCVGNQSVYGISAKLWERMDATERQAAIERFNRQTEINAQTRIQAKKAKKEAEEIAKQCHATDGNEVDPSKCKVITHRRFFGK